MGMVSSRGLMGRVTKASILKIKNMVKEDSTMVMGHIIKGTGLRGDSTGRVNLETRTVRFTRGGMSTGS